MSDVVVFAPSPVLTVTVENHGDVADIHVHAGGQGMWQARMLRTLGVSVTMCAALGGESGQVLRRLIEDEGVELAQVDGAGRNGAYIHDRRSGDRVTVAETPGDPISRHDLDELYGLTLGAALESGAVVLSGPADDDVVPADVYRRLASDLRSAGLPVVADLSGERLSAALAGGLRVLKVADDELRDDGRAPSGDEAELVDALHRLHAEGAEHVVISRADRPVLALVDQEVHEFTMPELEAADSSGAGDSLTAGIAATLARGGGIVEAVTTGVAAGALNVTRHGLGTGEVTAMLKLRDLVSSRRLEGSRVRSAQLSPAELARRAHEE